MISFEVYFQRSVNGTIVADTGNSRVYGVHLCAHLFSAGISTMISLFSHNCNLFPITLQCLRLPIFQNLNGTANNMISLVKLIRKSPTILHSRQWTRKSSPVWRSVGMYLFMCRSNKCMNWDLMCRVNMNIQQGSTKRLYQKSKPLSKP